MTKRATAIDGVLTAVFVTPLQAFWGHLASRLDKPVICFQHGEQGLFPEIFGGRLEATFATHYFAYGEGVVDKYRKFVGVSRLKEVEVVVYRPRVLGQWFDGIRFYAAASSPTRSRRTCAGLR